MHTFLRFVDSERRVDSLSDEVLELPGQPSVNFKQFAGYIAVDEAKRRSLFYYFVEAESNSSSKPLVLWFNGGNISTLCLIGFYEWWICEIEEFCFEFLQDLVVRLLEKGLLLSMVLSNQMEVFW